MTRFADEFVQAVWRLRADAEGDLSRPGAALMVELLGPLAGDELEVVGMVIERLRLGRSRYGQLDLARDERVWSREAAEEVIDGLIYAAIGAVVEARG